MRNVSVRPDERKGALTGPLNFLVVAINGKAKTRSTEGRDFGLRVLFQRLRMASSGETQRLFILRQAREVLPENCCRLGIVIVKFGRWVLQALLRRTSA